MSCTRWDLGAPRTWSQQLLFSLDQPHHSEGKTHPVCWPHQVYTLTFLSYPAVFTTGNPKWATITHKARAMCSDQEFQRENKTVEIWWKLRQRGWGIGKGKGLESGIKKEWMTVLVCGKKRRNSEGGCLENTNLFYCKRKLSFSSIPKDFFIPRKHWINPVVEKSLPKKGRLNMKCLCCTSDFLFLSSAQTVKELME